MEMNFDKHIKDSMDNFELPYDSSAWDKMSARLDQTMPVTPKSSPKWWIAATFATVAVIATTYLMTTNPSEKSLAKNTSTPEESTTENTVISSTPSTEKSNLIASENNHSKTTVDSKNTEHQQETVSVTNVDMDKDGIDFVRNEENHVPVTTPNSEKKYHISPIENTCAGNSITINNTNPIDLVLLQPNGKKTIIHANNDICMGATIPGEYELGYMKDNNFIAKEKFTVYPSTAKADIEIGEYEYENGIPAIHLSSNNYANSYEWSINKKHTSSKEAVAHLFEKGTYEIKLTTTSSNGCTSTDIEKITVAEDYNLLASTGFNLSDNDSKNKTWIPSALKTRNVRFTMTIIDPIDGGIVFQTNDASQPWDGTDSRTGNIVVPNSSWVWTVKISNPEQGERADYKGVIIRL